MCIGRPTRRYVTDSHFSTYHITGIRILITGRSFRAWIASAHAPCSRITDLISGAEQPVIGTGKVIRRICTDIVGLVAGIHGTVDPVITVRRRTCLAGAGSNVTGLNTGAEEAVIAFRVIRTTYRLALSV
jgi:hypothetical protein